MDTKTCLQKLQYVGVLAFATVDECSAPQIRNISAIHYETEAMYFFTAKGKDFCRQLLTDGRVQILGYTKYKEMIRLSARAKPACETEQQKWIDTIFEEQPYLSNVYPGDTRKLAGIVFEITDAEIEYFHLGVNPIFRESYTIGNGIVKEKLLLLFCRRCQLVTLVSTPSSRFCISRTASSVGTGITSMESIIVRLRAVSSLIMLSLI